MRNWHKILCPIDFSDPSEEGLRTAVRLADRDEDELWLLHVVQPPVMPYGADYYPVFGDDVRERLLTDAARRLELWAAWARGQGLKRVEAALEEGSPTEAILAFAGRVGADLIIVGTHGYRGLRHALLGSVAERLVQRARCGVLTVHPGERPGVALPHV